MRNAAELARALCQGWIDASGAPELADAETEADVRYRLRQVGHDLVLADKRWIALRSEYGTDLRGFVPRNGLGELEHAVVCACYLHLVFLPAEHGQPVGLGDHGLSIDEVIAPFIERGHRKGEVEEALRRVCQAGWARRTAGRLKADPPLLALDQPALHEMMYLVLMRRRIDRLAVGADRAA